MADEQIPANRETAKSKGKRPDAIQLTSFPVNGLFGATPKKEEPSPA